MYSWLSDEELTVKVEELRKRAHDAKLQNCFARARDWEVASNELQKRLNAPYVA
jgi:hypothetical protein